MTMELLIRHNLPTSLWWVLPLKVLGPLGLSLMILFWFPLNAVEAHRPSFPDGFNKSANSAFQLDDIDISQAIYQILKENEQVWLSFDPKSSDFSTTNIQLGIPVLKETEAFRPMVAVVAQNLKEADLPFDIPEGFGATVYETNDGNLIKKFHEPFTNTNSWILIEDEFEIVGNEIHYVVIFSKTNQSGKFWFATGRQEVFDFSSISNLGENISKVKEFHKPSIYPSDAIVQDKESNLQTLSEKPSYYKSLNIYLAAVLITLLLIFILARKRFNRNKSNM